METTTISARVPVALKADLKAFTRSQGITISEFISESFLRVNMETLVAEADDVKVEKDVMKMLTTFGTGTFVTVFIYKTLKKSLPIKFPKMSEEEIKVTAMVAAVSSGLLAGWGVKNLFNQ